MPDPSKREAGCKPRPQAWPAMAKTHDLKTVHYLIKHIDAKATNGQWETVSDVVWQYENRLDALDAADRYNDNLAAAGIPSWICCYTVSD